MIVSVYNYWGSHTYPRRKVILKSKNYLDNTKKTTTVQRRLVIEGIKFNIQDKLT